MRKTWPTVQRLGLATLAATALVLGAASAAAGQGVNVRDHWNADDLAVLASLRLSRLPPPPPDPSNSVAGSPAAAELGKRLFHDRRLSRNQAVACATCHDAQRQFQDGLALARGLGIGTRRAMPIVGSGYGPWLFWDGRKDSLWSQALGPLEDSVEHGGNRTRYAHLMQTHYRSDYEALFGAMADMGSAPRDASPNGTPAERAAWSAMHSQTQQQVSRIFANMGKAIAAYERTLAHEETRFDRYVEATLRHDPLAQQFMAPHEVRGLRTFIGKGQCVSCHNGPLFTDHHFHNTGVAPRDPGNPDRGRAAAVSRVQLDEFNCLGPFSDARPAQCEELRFMVTGDPALEGAFKTPSLRGVALRPPYMHAGQLGSLEDVIAHYVKAPPAAVGRSELASAPGGRTERQPLRLSDQEIRDLAAFLGAISTCRATAQVPAGS